MGGSLIFATRIQAIVARLAHASGRSPVATLRFVLHDGFDAVERSIQENANADAEFATGATATHADVMADAQKLVFQKVIREIVF